MLQYLQISVEVRVTSAIHATVFVAWLVQLILLMLSQRRSVLQYLQLIDGGGGFCIAEIACQAAGLVAKEGRGSHQIRSFMR